jgi:hypothetical protein
MTPTEHSWKTGVAEVVATNGPNVVVQCPHCEGTHQHARTAIGSSSVIAGCHRGFSRCREYRVVDLGSSRPKATRRPAA